MLSFTALTPFADPEITLHYCNSTRKRRTRIRKSGGQHKNQAILDEQRLVTWASTPISSLLVVRGTLDTKDETKDISTAVVDLLMTMEIPVLWVLNGKARPNGSVNSFVEVLKHLTWQALRLGVTTGPTISESFNAPLLQAIRTEAEWFNVLRILLSRFKIIYLVIDAEVLDMNGNSSTTKLLELYTYLQNFVAVCKPTVVKVLISSYRRWSKAQPATDPSTMVVACKRDRRSGLPFTQQRPSKKQRSFLVPMRESLRQQASSLAL